MQRMILEIYNLFNDHNFRINDVVKITFLYTDTIYIKNTDSVIQIPENQFIREHIWCHINSICENHLIVEIANPCYYSKNRNNKSLKPGDILRIHKKYVKLYKDYMSMEYIPSLPDFFDTNVSYKQNTEYHELKHKLELFRELKNIEITSINP